MQYKGGRSKMPAMTPSIQQNVPVQSSCFPDGSPTPDLLTEDELVRFLRIPEVSAAKDHRNVIQNLIRMRGLPRIQIGRRLLFPRRAILQWVEKHTIW